MAKRIESPSPPPKKWEDFDRVAKEKKRRIVKQAKKDAFFGIPSGEDLSNTENEIIADAHEYQQKLADAPEFFEELENNINSHIDFFKQENFKIIFHNLRNDVQNHINNVRLKLSGLETEHGRNTGDFAHFRKENGLDRPPVPCTPLKLIIALTIILGLFIFEGLMNSGIISGVLYGGASEGRSIAFAVAFINVFISFAVGYHSLKNLNHVDSDSKKISGFILVTYLFIIFYLNWAYGAFRSLSEKVAEGSEVNMGDVIFPWSIQLNFQGLTLLIVGLGFAVFSLLDGYFLDDSYPGYGKKARMLNKSRKNIFAELNNLTAGVQKIFNNRKKESEKKRDSLVLAAQDWSEKTNLLQTMFDSYRKKILSAEKDINHMLREYVIANKTTRNIDKYPFPKRFEDENPFSYMDDEKDPFKVFAVVFNVYMEDSPRREKKGNLLKETEEKYDMFTQQFSEFREETLVSIQKIQNQYENI